MKYSGEAKVSSGQQVLEEMENRLEEAKKRYRNTLEVIKIIEKHFFSV